MWAALPITAGEHPSFTVSFQRNQQTFPDLEVRADELSQHDGPYIVGVSEIPAGGGGCYDSSPQAQPVLCFGAAIDGLQVPLVDGDDYHWVVTDESGHVVIDEHWTATYTDGLPAACDNTRGLHCRYAFHEAAVK